MDKQQLFGEVVSQTDSREPRVLQPRLQPDEGKNTLFPSDQIQSDKVQTELVNTKSAPPVSAGLLTLIGRCLSVLVAQL